MEIKGKEGERWEGESNKRRMREGKGRAEENEKVQIRVHKAAGKDPGGISTTDSRREQSKFKGPPEDRPWSRGAMRIASRRRERAAAAARRTHGDSPSRPWT